MQRVSVKPGLWTGLDYGLDWTMDSTGLDYGLDWTDQTAVYSPESRAPCKVILYSQGLGYLKPSQA